ncbi:MAG: penicillin-binding protein 1C, partial [Chthoniobacterales bacterium]
EIHREVWVDNATGLRLNGDNGNARREVDEFWPSDLLELFDAAGLPRRRPPPFLPGANVEMAARAGQAPRIISPQSDVIYSLGEESAPNRALSLRAETEADVAKVYWFADRTFLGTTNRTTPLNWEPKPGHYTIIALDDHGRSDSRAIICSR